MGVTQARPNNLPKPISSQDKCWVLVPGKLCACDIRKGVGEEGKGGGGGGEGEGGRRGRGRRGRERGEGKGGEKKGEGEGGEGGESVQVGGLNMMTKCRSSY